MKIWRFFAGFLLAAFACLVAIAAAHAGSMMVLGAGSGGPPGYDRTAAIDCEFILGQCYDAAAGGLVAPSTLLTDTRSVAAPYDPGTSITTSIGSNTLPLGSVGLQVFQNNINYALQTTGNLSVSPWATQETTSTLPTVTVNPHFGSSGCTAADTAPDGSCNTTELAFPALTGSVANQQSTIIQLVTGLTSSTTYTYCQWLKNSAAVANPQTYLSVQEGATPFNIFGQAFVQPGPTWTRFSLTFTVPATFTSAYIEIGNTTATSISPTQANLGGGTMEAWVSQVNLGTTCGPYVPTTTTAATTPALDNIAATGHLATALASSNAAVAITIQNAGNLVAGTMLDSNGTILLGKSATDFVTTALGASLTSKAKGNFSASETAYLAWNGSGGSINLNGTPVVTDATARTGVGTFHVGTTSGTTAPCNCNITSLKVYPSAVTPPLVASVPITGVTISNIATLSSGTLITPTVFVIGDSWAVTEDASGNNWTLCNDCGYGSISGALAGNVVLGGESTWTAGTPGFFQTGPASGGPPGLTNSFNSNLGTFNSVQSSTQNTWKSCGLIAIKDGTNTDLFAGFTFDSYGLLSTNWVQSTSAATIASVVSTSAATPASWNGLPPSPAVLPISTPTFSTEQFGSPCFITYAPGYVNSGLPTPNPDNSGSYLYATSNDGGWNMGSNIYVARIPLATILTSLSGSLAAASTPSNWQFYNSAGCTGGNGLLSGCWGSLASATPIFTLTNRLSRSAMTYLPTTNRYLLQEWYYPTINGPIASTQTTGQSSALSEFEFIDCDKPWHCNSVVSTIDYGNATASATLGYYSPVIVPPSLALDGGFTATAIFTGNFNGQKTFSAGDIYAPTMGQMSIRY